MNTGTLSPAEISGEVQLRGPAGGEAKTASTVDCLKYILGMFGYCGGNLEFSDNNKCELSNNVIFNFKWGVNKEVNRSCGLGCQIRVTQVFEQGAGVQVEEPVPRRDTSLRKMSFVSMY